MRKIGVSGASALVLVVSVLAGLTEGGNAQQRPGINPVVNLPEGCYVADPVNTESLGAFIKAQIQALSFAREGERADREMLGASDGPPVERIPKVLAGLRQEKVEDTCASFVISSYADSKNETVAAVAKVLAFAYDDLANMTNEMLKLTLEDSRKQKPGLSTAKALSDLKLRRQEALQRVAEALNISLSLLVDGSRTGTDGQPDHLTLSHSERDELLEYLNSQFPNLENEQTDGHAGDFVKQAVLIESFLAGKYKPSDR